MTRVPSLDSSTSGRSMSVRAAMAAGLFGRSKSSGTTPRTSPPSTASSMTERYHRAWSMSTTGRHCRPRAAAVTAVVDARSTSTATMASAYPYRSIASGKQSMTTVPSVAPPVPPPSINGGIPERIDRPQPAFGEGIGVQTVPVDLDPQQLLEPDVGQLHVGPEVVEQGELAALGRRLEDQHVKTELVSQRVGVSPVEFTGVVEESDTAGALPRLDDEL